MAPPVEEMETRDVSLVLSDMIKYGRYKPITTGRKLGYQPTLSSTGRDLATRAVQTSAVVRGTLLSLEGYLMSPGGAKCDMVNGDRSIAK